MGTSSAGKGSATRLLEELIETARRCGITVRREKLLREVGYRARSGACRLKDQTYIILDRDQHPREQLELIAEVLKERSLGQIDLSSSRAHLSLVDSIRRD